MKLRCGSHALFASSVLIAALFLTGAAEAASNNSKSSKPKMIEYLVSAENRSLRSNASFRLMEKGKERYLTGLEVSLGLNCNDAQSRVVSISADDMPDWASVSKYGKAAGKFSYVDEYSNMGDAVVTVWFILDNYKLKLHARRTQTGVVCDGDSPVFTVTGRTRLTTKVYAPLIIHDDVDHYINVQDGVPTGYLVAGTAKCPGFEINGNEVAIAIVCSTAGDVSVAMSGDGKLLHVLAETKSSFYGNPVSTTCETTGRFVSARDRWVLTTKFSYQDPIAGLDCASTFSESLVRW